MNSSQKLKVEKVFTEFVKLAGGESLDEKFKEIANIPLNADYFFDKEKLIVELKCLEVDSHNSDSGRERMFRSIDKHTKNGNLSGHQVAEWLFKNKPCPEPIYKDLCNRLTIICKSVHCLLLSTIIYSIYKVKWGYNLLTEVPHVSEDLK